MSSSLKENLITTKDASELSGYTSDYLARLVRSGEIVGKRIGRSWLIDSESLEIFLEKQKSRKTDRSRGLASVRAEEYRRHHSLVRRITKNLTERVSVPQLDMASGTLRSHLFAFSAALAIIVSGATLARADVLPQIAGQVASIAKEVAYGAGETFGSIPAHIANKFNTVHTSMVAVHSHVVDTSTFSSIQLASPMLAEPDLSSVRMVLNEGHSSSGVLSSVVSVSSSSAETVPLVTVGALSAFARDACTIAASPVQAASALAHAYTVMGMGAYESITASLSAYRAFIERSGVVSFGLAVATRDNLATTPRAVSYVAITIGQSVIDASHAAIHADVATAYGIAAAAPASARVTVSIIGGAGNGLAIATAKVPHLAQTLYLRTAAMPATFAPALAQAVFGAEYAAATRFVSIVGGVSDRYLALIETAGRAAYVGAEGTRSLASALIGAPPSIEDAYLGALGKTALALETVSSVSSVAAAIVASTPALSAGEKVALSVYSTIHSAFDSATDVLALIFTPPSIPVMVQHNSRVPQVVVATTPPARPAQVLSQTVNSYPTYTTLVRGVSQDELDQKLSILRSNILATTAGMIQPVAAQGATNATTIQYVNMIQDLTDLKVHNGSFMGGTFDGGSLTNGLLVSATDGVFTNATSTNFFATTASSTNLFASTAQLGSLSVLGNAAYTGTLAQTGLATFTNGFLSNASSTITSGLFSMGGGASTTNITASGTGYFASLGGAVVSALTANYLPKWNSGTLANSLIYDDGTNVGIGTTSPYARFSVTGAAGSSTNLFAISTSTAGFSTSTALSVDQNGNLSLLNGAGLSVSGTSAHTGLATFTNGFLSNASSTITSGLFSMNGGASTTQLTATGSTYLATAGGGVGIGTTTLDSALSILQSVNGIPIISAYRATDSAPSGDFISYKSSAGTPLFRVDNSGNLMAGGIINTGSQTITSTSQPQFRVQYDASNEWTASTNATGGTTFGVNGSTPSLTFTPLSNSANTFNFTNALASNSILSIDTLSQRVGINNAAPTYSLDVTGNGHFTSLVDASHFVATSSSATSLFNGHITVSGNSLFSNATTTNLFSTTASSTNLFASTAQLGSLSILGNTTHTGTLAQTGLATFTNGFLSNASSTITSGLFSMNGGASTTQLTTTGSTYLATSGGNVGIGTTAPGGLLDLQTGVGLALRLGADVNATTRTNAIRKFARIGMPHYLSAEEDVGLFSLDSDSTYNAINFGGGSLAMNAATKLSFWTANDTTTVQGTEKMTINNLGNVGIGSTTPWGLLSVNANAIGSAPQFVVGSSTATNFIVANNGYVGIGTATPTSKLHVNGGITAQDNIQGYGLYTVGSGTVSAPALNINATGVGLYRPAAGIVGIVGNSVEIARFDGNTGNVGIGTTSPAALLQVGAATGGAGASSEGLLLGNNKPISFYDSTGTARRYMLLASNTYIGQVDSGWSGGSTIFGAGTNMRFFINGATTLTESMRLSATGGLSLGTATWNGTDPGAGNLAIQGNVGIGTTTPYSRLSVWGAGTGATSMFELTNSASTTLASVLNDGTVYMKGNVGIGTTSPGQLLTVGGSAVTGTFSVQTPGGETFSINRVSAGNISFNAGGGSTFAGGVDLGARFNIAPVNDSLPTLAVRGYTGGVSDIVRVSSPTVTTGDLFIIKSTGNVGIGTTTPWGLLSVNANAIGSASQFVVGSSTATNFIVANGGNVGIGTTDPGYKLHIYAGASGVSLPALPGVAVESNTHQAFYMASAANAQQAFFFGYPSSYYQGGIAYEGGTRGDRLDLYAGATQRMSILSTGNVGIGTTTPTDLLHIASTLPKFYITDTNSALNNKHWFMENNAGVLSFGTTTDALAVSATRALSITNTGNVGIGTTSPVSLLNIAGGTAQLTISDSNSGQGTVITSLAFRSDVTGVNAGSVGFAGDGNLAITNSYSTGDIYLTTTGAGDVLINNGNVGIGTTSPTAQLTLVKADSSGLTDLLVNPTAKTSGNLIDLQVNGASKFSVDNSGIASVTNYIKTANGITSSGTNAALVMQNGVQANNATPSVSITPSLFASTAFNTAVLSITPTIGQSGSAGYTALDINVTESSLGSGSNYLMNAQVGGTSKFVIQNTGNVGIGSTTPWGLLSVNANAIGAAPQFVVGSSTATNFIVANGGNVGIGTATPTAGKLVVLGGVANSIATIVASLGSGNNAVNIGDDGTDAVIGAGNSSSKLHFLKRVAGVYDYAMTIDSTGNVGIGTTTPGALLDVADGEYHNRLTGSTLDLHRERESFAGTTPFGSIRFRGTDTDSGNPAYTGAQIYGYADGDWGTGDAPGRLEFFTTPDGSSTGLSRMTIKNDGNVGIGSTTPWGLLSVNANAIGSASQFVVGSSTATNFIVANGGNVGIGTTEPLQKLEVKGGNIAVTTDTTGAIGLGNGINFNPVNNAGSYAKVKIGVYDDIGGSWNRGNLAFMLDNTADGSNADISDTVLYLQRSGNVGIGTTSPASKLDVYGGDFALTGTGVSTGLTSIANGTAGFLASLTSQTTGGVTLSGMSSLASSAAKPMILQAISGADPDDTTPMMTFRTGRRSGTGGVNNADAETAFQWQKYDETALMTMLGNGNVGIGTASPASALDVVTTASADVLRLNRNSDIDATVRDFARFYRGATAVGGLKTSNDTTMLYGLTNLVLGINEVEKVRIDSNGNVGIGTTSPATSLHIQNTSTGFEQGLKISTFRYPNVYFDSYDSGYWGDIVLNAVATGYSSGGSLAGAMLVRSQNSIQLAPNDTVAVTLSTTGNVGIGTTSPAKLLHIAGSGSGAADILIGETSQGVDLKNFAISNRSQYLEFGTQNDAVNNFTAGFALSRSNGIAVGAYAGVNAPPTNGMIISGNVGIGTTTPGAKLDVYQSTAGLNTMDLTNSTSNLTVDMTPASGFDSYITNARVGADIYFRTSNASYGDQTPLTLLANGNVGIGTTNPLGKLVISNNGALGLEITPGITAFGLANVNYIASYDRALSAYKDIVFDTGLDGSPALIIKNGGNVGIGTTTPGAKLEVDADSNDQLILRRTTAGVEQAWYFGQNSKDLVIGTGPTSGLADAKFTIQDTGNVGIGTASPVAKLDVFGTQALTGATASNYISFKPGGTQKSIIGTAGAIKGTAAVDLGLFAETGLGMSFMVNGSATDAMTIASTGKVGIGQTNPATTLSLAQDTGILSWGNNDGSTQRASILGTSANALTFSILGSEKMILTTDGNVGIGTTSPNARLNVYGVTPGTAEIRINDFGGGDYSILSSLGGVNKFAIHDRTAGVTRLAIDSTGNVGVGTTSPATLLEVGGVAANVTFDFYKSCAGFTSDANGKLLCTASDQRLKQEITALATSTALAGINALDPVSFYWNPATGRGSVQQFGLIAQQVQAVFPNLVNTTSPTDLTPDGTLVVNYEGLIAPMVLAIQQLDSKFAIPAEATSTPSAVLTADGEGVDLYKLATYAVSNITDLSSRIGAQDIRLTSLEDRVTALENGSVSVASGSPVSFSTSTLASALESFGVLIQKGVAQFNTLVFRQLVASKDADGTSSAGSVTILTGNTVAQVNNSLVLPTTKVFVTFNSEISGSWWVSDKTSGAFRVVLSSPQAVDVSFDYFLVQTEGQIATSTSNVAQGVSQSSGPDTVPPEITLLGDNPMRLSVGGIFTEPGVTVTDNIEGIGSYVTYVNGIEQEASAGTIDTSSATTYIITYKATDARGNISTARRSVIIGDTGGAEQSSIPDSNPQEQTSSADTTAPIVTLNGDAAMQLTSGDAFTDPGATSTDDTDGSLTPVVSGAVDTATPGLYTLTYAATDAAGNTGSVSRVVTVTAPEAAQ